MDSRQSDTPERIGKYEILGRLGEGGMATVFRGRMRGLGHATKDVAIKVIAAHLDGERDFQLMFLDEARVAMALSHRNIVQTFDAGRFGARAYLVMELVEGLSLRQLLSASQRAGQPLPMDVVLFIVMELCAALQHAHSFERDGHVDAVVHRDVSPSNVLLSRSGDVKLNDFGVAKARGRIGVSSADLIKGKLTYMAPEQARGAVEPRSDIYSVGAVLYELVCNAPIRRGATLDSVRSASLPPLPQVHGAKVPPGVESALLACLAPRPSGRPASAGALRATLAAELLALKQSGAAPDTAERLAEIVRGYAAAKERRSSVARAGAAGGGKGDAAARLKQAMMAEALEVEARSSSRSHTDEVAEAFESSTTIARPMPAAVRPEPAGRVEGTALLPVSSAPSILPAREAAQRPRRRRRGLLLLSAGLFVATAVVVSVLLFVLRDEGQRPVGAAGARKPMVPGYARRLPVLRSAGTGASAKDAGAVSAGDGAVAAVAGSPDAEPPASAADAGAGSSSAVAAGDAASADVAARRTRRRSRRSRRSRRHRRGRRRLRSRGYGRLDINAVPWAVVYIDGRRRGVTPLQNIRLAAGVHRVRLVNARRRLSRRLRVRVRRGKRTRVVSKLR